MQESVDASRELGMEMGTTPPCESEINKREFGGATSTEVIILRVLFHEQSISPAYRCRLYIGGTAFVVCPAISKRSGVDGRAQISGDGSGFPHAAWVAPGLRTNPIDLGSLGSGKVALWASCRNGFASKWARTNSVARELGKPCSRLTCFCFD